MSAQTQTPNIYRLAAQMVKDRGLLKGSFGPPGTPHCTVGALMEARGVHVPQLVGDEVRTLAQMLGFDPSKKVYGIALDDILGPDWAWVTPLTDWNDLPATTAEDVVLVLEQAAEKFEAEL